MRNIFTLALSFAYAVALAAVNASALATTLTINGVTTDGIVSVTTQGPSPSPTPTPTPPPQNGCAAPAGWTCQINPVSNVQSSISQFGTPFNINQDTIWIFSVPPNVVQANQIMIRPGAFPNDKVQIMTNQYLENINPRDIVVSNQPGSQIEVGFGCTRRGSIEGAYLFLTTSSGDYGMCVLQPNTPYWINIKATSPSVPMNYLISPQPM